MRVIYLFLFLCTSSSLAVDFVYRVDSRPPNEIFRDGFQSHGDNRNLQQHIRGDSCAGGSRDSIYIATTSDVNETRNIARQYFSRMPFSGRLYRYRIRADSQFYSLFPSVSHLTSQGVRFSQFERIMLREQNEYVVLSHIPTGNIAEAVELVYDWRTSSVRDGTGTSNAHYVNIQTESNQGVIPNLPTPQVSTRERILAFGSLISVCFSMRGVRQINPDISYDLLYFYDARPVLKQLLVNSK